MRETDIGKIMVDYFQDREWEVYQEVRAFGKTCDLVAVSGKFSWAVECKRGGLFNVMAQAHDWLGMASFVSIAMPWPPKKRAEHRFAYEICRYLGIGFFAIRDDDAHELFRPRFFRRLNPDKITDYLCEGQKTFAPAGSKGGYFSPFKQTCDSLRWYVKAHPGCSVKEAMNGIDHHYSSEICARASMLQWLHKGIVKGVEVRKEGRKLYLFPVSNGERGFGDE